MPFICSWRSYTVSTAVASKTSNKVNNSLDKCLGNFPKLRLFYAKADITNLMNTYVNYDTPYLSEIHTELLKADAWRTPGVKALVQFTWEIYLCTLYPYLSEPSKVKFLYFFLKLFLLLPRLLQQSIRRLFLFDLKLNYTFCILYYFFSRWFALIREFFNLCLSRVLTIEIII
jgi:hypothetical protein